MSKGTQDKNYMDKSFSALTYLSKASSPHARKTFHRKVLSPAFRQEEEKISKSFLHLLHFNP